MFAYFFAFFLKFFYDDTDCSLQFAGKELQEGIGSWGPDQTTAVRYRRPENGVNASVAVGELFIGCRSGGVTVCPFDNGEWPQLGPGMVIIMWNLIRGMRDLGSGNNLAI